MKKLSVEEVIALPTGSLLWCKYNDCRGEPRKPEVIRINHFDDGSGYYIDLLGSDEGDKLEENTEFYGPIEIPEELK